MWAHLLLWTKGSVLVQYGPEVRQAVLFLHLPAATTVFLPLTSGKNHRACQIYLKLSERGHVTQV